MHRHLDRTKYVMQTFRLISTIKQLLQPSLHSTTKMCDLSQFGGSLCGLRTRLETSAESGRPLVYNMLCSIDHLLIGNRIKVGKRGEGDSRLPNPLPEPKWPLCISSRCTEYCTEYGADQVPTGLGVYEWTIFQDHYMVYQICRKLFNSTTGMRPVPML